MDWKGAFVGALGRIAGLDLRSLAVMRIGYGLLVVCDLINRAWRFRFHYTEAGAMPLETMFRQASTPGDFSVHAINGTLGFALLLYGLHFAAGVCLLVGHRTQMATALCWLMTASLQDRNFALLNGGDTWMRLILFWAIFLPWGRRWSLDAGGRPDNSGASFEVASVASAAYLLQEVNVYFFSGLHKTGPSWWKDGSAVYYSLHLDEWSSAMAKHILYLPELLRLSSFAVLACELTLPLLLLSPWLKGPLRSVVVVAAVAFHTGLVIFMKLGIFPFVGIVSALGLLPTWAWQRLPLRLLEGRLDRFWSRPSLKRLARVSSSGELVPSGLGRLPIVVLAIFGVVWNVANLKVGLQLPYSVQTAGRFLNVDQNWELFAPDPPTLTGWMVVEGVLKGGKTVDLLRGEGPSTRRRPSVPADIYRSQREKRYFVVLGNPQYEKLWRPYCEYLFRWWQGRHPEQRLEQIRLVWMSQKTLPNFEDRPPQANLRFQMKNPR